MNRVVYRFLSVELLAILATLHPDHDYDWLARCPAVLDCTYRRPDAGQRRFLP